MPLRNYSLTHSHFDVGLWISHTFATLTGILALQTKFSWLWNCVITNTAVVHRDNTKCVRLPDTASIFRAELYAILLAIDVVRRSKEKNFVIFSDSMSSLQSISGFSLDSDLVQKFLKDYTILAKMAKTLFSVGSLVM